MGKPSAEKLAQRVLDRGLLDEYQLQEVWASLGSRNVKTNEFLRLLVRRELLTNYQVELIVKGERAGFFFGDYRVLYMVGAGTFARVFRAAHKQTGQVVAVKVLRKRYSENPDQYGQFVREGQVGCRLRHPNVVPTYEVVSQGKTHFLVMEFVEGQNLSEFVKNRGKLDPFEATRLMTEICEGMKHAFEKGMTHRDLKMNNVLVSSRGQAKLVDFGLAALEEPLDDDALADLPNSRTIDYAALERVTGVRKDDPRSDIYFLGCIYYHMLSGKPPLRPSRDRVHRLSRSRFTEVKPIRKIDKSIPHSVALVVNKAMMLDPAHRYQSPTGMLSDLKIAARRLVESSAASLEKAEASTSEGDQAPAVPEIPLALRPSVMIVESNSQMQDIFRKGFKRAGYRVLLTSDPDRALARFQQEPGGPADCIVLNAQEVGSSALEVFNEFGDDQRTNFIPAVLLLGDDQRGWKKKAQTTDHRIVLPMPITMKKLRTTLAKLVASNASG